MAVEFTKATADYALECVEQLIAKLPNTTIGRFIGEINYIFQFLESAKIAAPKK